MSKTILVHGSGAPGVVGQILTLHCSAYVKKRKFWCTRDEGKPYLYRIGTWKQIEGWNLSVPTMKVGEKARVKISSNYAYGSEGLVQWNIPPHANLIYEIELLEIS